MTETDHLHQKLRETQIAYQSALQSSYFQAGFLSRIAHELRSPLSTLMGLHQMIIADLCENGEEERQFISEAYQYAKKLMGLIDQLVEVSKLGIGKIPLDLESIEVAVILSHVKNLMDLQAANRNLKLKLLPVDQNTKIVIDQARLFQTLCSLIEVAIDHSEFGTISISAQTMECTQQVIINIDLPENSHKIAEPVDLIQPSLSELKPLNHLPQLSSGMKIILAQNLLEIMGGGLDIVSGETEKTARLCLYLPI